MKHGHRLSQRFLSHFLFIITRDMYSMVFVSTKTQKCRCLVVHYEIEAVMTYSCHGDNGRSRNELIGRNAWASKEHLWKTRKNILMNFIANRKQIISFVSLYIERSVYDVIRNKVWFMKPKIYSWVDTYTAKPCFSVRIIAQVRKRILKCFSIF